MLDTVEIKKIETKEAPQAIGPYSQAVAFGSLIFVSGQLPINPEAGKIVDLTIQGQTEQVLKNLLAILQAANLSFKDVVRTDIFLKDLNQFAEMNAIYANWFSQPIKPARQTVQVARLPLDALVEISCIAMKSQQ